jgi:hypothetical protein
MISQTDERSNDVNQAKTRLVLMREVEDLGEWKDKQGDERGTCTLHSTSRAKGAKIVGPVITNSCSLLFCPRVRVRRGKCSEKPPPNGGIVSIIAVKMEESNITIPNMRLTPLANGCWKLSLSRPTVPAGHH